MINKNDLYGFGLGAIAATLLAVAAWMFDEMRRDGAPVGWVLVGVSLLLYDLGVVILWAIPVWGQISRPATLEEI